MFRPLHLLTVQQLKSKDDTGDGEYCFLVFAAAADDELLLSLLL